MSFYDTKIAFQKFAREPREAAGDAIDAEAKKIRLSFQVESGFAIGCARAESGSGGAP